MKSKITALFDPQVALDWLPNLASIFMSVTKAFLHVGIMVENYASYGSGGDDPPKFYVDWAPNSLDLLGKLDKERMEGAAALGVVARNHWDLVQGWYGSDYDDYGNFFSTFVGYQNVMAPTTADHRYLFEDAKCVLMLMRDVINKADMETPVMDDTLKKASEMMGEDLFNTGLTLERLGLKDVDVKEVVALLNVDNI